MQRAEALHGRMYGRNAPVGIIYGVNPLIIIFLVPLVGALFTKVQHFDMIHYGSYLSALAPFWIVAFPQGAPRLLACGAYAAPEVYVGLDGRLEGRC